MEAAAQEMGEPVTNGASGGATADEGAAEANRKARLVLAERRTAYALLRTGLAVTAVPLSIFTVLAATTRFWHPTDQPLLLGGVAAVCVGLLILGGYLVIHSVRNIRRTEAALDALQAAHAALEIDLISERWK